MILLVARHPESFWTYPAIAVAGSVAGTAITFWVGHKIREVGLERIISGRKLDRVKRKVRAKGAFAAGFLALAPPPFPFTPMVLAAGAFDVSFSRFLVTAALMRAVRFGAEGLLARKYGESIIAWAESPAFKAIAGSFIAIAIARYMPSTRPCVIGSATKRRLPEGRHPRRSRRAKKRPCGDAPRHRSLDARGAAKVSIISNGSPRG